MHHRSAGPLLNRFLTLDNGTHRTRPLRLVGAKPKIHWHHSGMNGDARCKTLWKPQVRCSLLGGSGVCRLRCVRVRFAVIHAATDRSLTEHRRLQV